MKGFRRTAITSYKPTLIDELISRVSQGETLREITKDSRFPTRATIYRWLAENPELYQAYEDAREASAQAYEEELLDMARELKGQNEFTALKTKQLEVAMGQYRWSATRRDPKRYAERRDSQVVVPIQINTTLDLGGGPGTPEHPNIYHIEPKPEVEGTPTPTPTPALLPPPPAPKPKRTRGRSKAYKGKTQRGERVSIANYRRAKERKLAETH